MRLTSPQSVISIIEVSIVLALLGSRNLGLEALGSASQKHSQGGQAAGPLGDSKPTSRANFAANFASTVQDSRPKWHGKRGLLAVILEIAQKEEDVLTKRKVSWFRDFLRSSLLHRFLPGCSDHRHLLLLLDGRTSRTGDCSTPSPFHTPLACFIVTRPPWALIHDEVASWASGGK